MFKFSCLGGQRQGEHFYEYVRPPCVYQPFFLNPQKVKKRNWASVPCVLKAKIGWRQKLESMMIMGMDLGHLRNVTRVAVVYNVPYEDYVAGMAWQQVDEDSQTYFCVLWSNETLIEAIAMNCDATAGCSKANDGSYMCDIHVTKEKVFSSRPTRH